MNQQQSNWKEKLLASAQRCKAFLSKDYSFHDLKKLISFAQTRKDQLLDIALHQTAGKKGQGASTALNQLSLNKTVDFKTWVSSLQVFAQHQRHALLLLLALVVLFLTYLFALKPYEQSLQSELRMRPTQWAQLQSLIKLTKPGSASASSGMTMMAPLDEMELQKLRGLLNARGIKPAVFRMTTDNPPALELQVSDVMFSVWLDVLEEFRSTWRLYPASLKVEAGSSAGMVNISASLSQWIPQFSAGRIAQ